MTKKQFIDIMEKFVSIKKDIDLVINAKIKTKIYGFDDDFGYFEDLFIDTLRIAINDEPDWLGYWIYDCEMGRNDKAESLTLEDKRIPFKTLSNLYDCINKYN